MLSVNKGYFSHQITTTATHDGKLWGNFWVRQMGCPLPSPHPWQPPTKLCSKENSAEGKYRLTGPDSWDVCQRDDFNDSRLLHLPICRKALNSLNWGIYFSLVNSIFLFYVLDSCCKTLTYPDTSLTSSKQSP